VPWCTDNITWNNIVFRTLKDGHLAEISAAEQMEFLQIFHLENLSASLPASQRMDAFFFSILKELHARYQNDNQIMDSLLGGPMVDAPHWSNFNQYQLEQHLKQLEPVVV
jgi:hypothetical protein